MGCSTDFIRRVVSEQAATDTICTIAAAAAAAAAVFPT
jgi:hypothetical protein